jgi:hypothetical protein
MLSIFWRELKFSYKLHVCWRIWDQWNLKLRSACLSTNLPRSRSRRSGIQSQSFRRSHGHARVHVIRRCEAGRSAAWRCGVQLVSAKYCTVHFWTAEWRGCESSRSRMMYIIFWNVKGGEVEIDISIPLSKIHTTENKKGSEFLATDPEARVRFPALPKKK